MFPEFENKLKWLTRCERGAAAAEFVLVLPLLLILVFAAVEVGRLMHDYHVVTKSVRDATRYLS